MPTHPSSVPAGLLDSAHTVFTPHLGSAVASVRLAVEHRAADNVLAVLAVLAGHAPPDAINQPLPRAS